MAFLLLNTEHSISKFYSIKSTYCKIKLSPELIASNFTKFDCLFPHREKL